MNTQSSYRRIPSSRRILENIIILMLVTFLLGTVAVYSSGGNGASKNTDVAVTQKEYNNQSFLNALQKTFVRPYTSAWKKLASMKFGLGNTFAAFGRNNNKPAFPEQRQLLNSNYSIFELIAP